tara:strand:+ start:490 stop:933 length:444 start_codon:yes stop_codon:yes gene_type:complete
MNKRTALVYGGAAFLILVFGAKTLSRTVDSLGFLESILTPLTIIALLSEFSLLLWYANGIYNQPEDNYTVQTGSGNGNGNDLGPALGKLNEINSTMSDFTDQMADINDHLANHNKQIVTLNIKLEEIVDSQLDEKVKSVLSSMIRNK